MGGLSLGNGSCGRLANNTAIAAKIIMNAIALKPILYPPGSESARNPIQIGAATVEGRSTNCSNPPIVPNDFLPKK